MWGHGAQRARTTARISMQTRCSPRRAACRVTGPLGASALGPGAALVRRGLLAPAGLGAALCSAHSRALSYLSPAPESTQLCASQDRTAVESGALEAEPAWVSPSTAQLCGVGSAGPDVQDGGSAIPNDLWSLHAPAGREADGVRQAGVLQSPAARVLGTARARPDESSPRPATPMPENGRPQGLQMSQP